MAFVRVTRAVKIPFFPFKKLHLCAGLYRVPIHTCKYVEKKNETNPQNSSQKNNAGKMNWIGDLKNAIE